MALQLDTVVQLCQQITRQVKDSYKVLTVHFVVHHDGQRNEALGITAQEIIHHPAAETAMRLMQHPRLNEESTLMGTAVARHNVFMGLAWRDHLLALCTLNIDHLQSLKESRRQAWHLTWHAIDAYNYHDNPNSRSGPASDIIVRRRSATEMARANLRADVFSAIMCAMQGDKSALKDIGKFRAINALSTRSAHMPEFYPYAIAMEATEFSFNELGKKLPSKRMMIPTALKIAHTVDRAIDKETLMNWFSFCEPAQDMAWRGFNRQDILSAAINTSPDTFVRSTGHMIKDMIAVEPSSYLNVSDHYSSYADETINEKLHEKLIEQIFEDVIAKGIKQHNADPFIKLANKQNEELSEGRMMGWCASGLQAAAKALESTKEGDRHAEHLVRKEFQSNKEMTNWDALQNLGNRIVQHQRDGEIITMSRLSEIAGEDKASKSIQSSVQGTLNDPGYKSKLGYVNAPTLAPSSPAPRAPAPSVAPRMAAAPAMRVPILGGTGSAVQRTVTKKNDDKGDQGRQTQ